VPGSDNDNNNVARTFIGSGLVLQFK